MGAIYAKYFKRILDFSVSLVALVVLSPVLLVLTVLGVWFMKGNPFFFQERPGKDEQIFRLVKFRSMSCERDKTGQLLPDSQRLNAYGRFLRASSLDELPELFNILRGEMSLVGPRPLLVKYLPLYNAEQRKRHSVLPGLTGLAQINGRNCLSWEDKFRMDVAYAKNITFIGDIKILLATVGKVFRREGISSATSDTMEEFTGSSDCGSVLSK